MLACYITLLHRRAAIAALLEEPANASDDPGTGNVVFATLVDDPASVGESVDALVGEVMLEVASATDAFSLSSVYAVAVTEAVTATEMADGSVAVIPTTATWDPATVAAVTLSGGNLVATNTGTTANEQGAHVASANGKTSGKYYVEMTFTDVTHNGVNRSIGIGAPTSTYTGLGNNATTGVIYQVSGGVFANGSYTFVNILGWTQGDTQGLAIDLDNRKIWFKKVNGTPGNWNNDAAQNPATNSGGFAIPAGTMVPFVTFGGSSGTPGNIITANFGASTFTGAVPSGFTSGWPL